MADELWYVVWDVEPSPCPEWGARRVALLAIRHRCAYPGHGENSLPMGRKESGGGVIMWIEPLSSSPNFRHLQRVLLESALGGSEPVVLGVKPGRGWGWGVYNRSYCVAGLPGMLPTGTGNIPVTGCHDSYF